MKGLIKIILIIKEFTTAKANNHGKIFSKFPVIFKVKLGRSHCLLLTITLQKGEK